MIIHCSPMKSNILIEKHLLSFLISVLVGFVSICWAGLLAGNVEEIIQERGWTSCYETWGVQASFAKRAGTKTKPTRRRTSSCWSGWVRQRTCKILTINYAVRSGHGYLNDDWMTHDGSAETKTTLKKLELKLSHFEIACCSHTPIPPPLFSCIHLFVSSPQS